MCLLAEGFVAYFVSTKGALCLTVLLEEKNPNDVTILEVNLAGIFKVMYVGRRRSPWMEKALLICNPCWPENLKEVSPCVWKVFADHLRAYLTC